MLALLACRESDDAPAPALGFRCPELQWVHAIDGSSSYPLGWKVDIATDGDILVGGAFSGTDVVFGIDSGRQVSLSSCVGRNAFVARYGPDGPIRWAYRFDQCGYSETAAIAHTADGGMVATGDFDHEIEALGRTFSRSGLVEDPDHVWVAKWSAGGTLEWFVAGYVDFLSGGASITTDADGYVYVAGSFISITSGLTFTNGLAELMRWPDPQSSYYDSFLTSFGPDGTARWLQVFGTPLSDGPGQIAVTSDQVVAALPGSVDTVWTFDPTNPDGTYTQNGSSLARWRASDGAWQQARHIAEPVSSRTVALVVAAPDRLLSATWAGQNNTYGEGDSALTWEDPLAHGLISEWSPTDLAWRKQALLDDNPRQGTGSVDPHWLDARSDGWAVASGWVGGKTTFTTNPPQTVEVSSDGGGDGYVGLLDPDLVQQCAYWMPGPGVEDVRAALDDKGGIAVVGTYSEITLEPGTDREVTLTATDGAQGFVAYFAPPDGAVQ